MTIDSYLHVGHPRFGSAEDALRTMDAHDIERAVWVHGPYLPDFPALLAGMRLAGDRIRCVSVPLAPWQGDQRQAEELVDRMLDAGVRGFRIQGQEYERIEYLLACTGERGGWIYAINPHQKPEYAERLLRWLGDHEDALVVLPHFLGTDASAIDRPHMGELLAHQRVAAILSRHGGASQEAYPHPDLAPWAETVIERCGWDRVLWGGEYPVLYWRDETLPAAREWLRALLGEVSDTHWRAFTHDNAERLLFAAEAEHDPQAGSPEWLRWDANDVALKTFALDGELHARVLAAYVRANADSLSGFHDFLRRTLARGLDRAQS